MIVRVESPADVSICSTATAGGMSSGVWGFGRIVGRGCAVFCAFTDGASVAKASAPTRKNRFMSGSIYVIHCLYTGFSLAISVPGNAKPRRGFLRGFTRSGCSLVGEMKLKRHLHELLNLFTPDLRRRELHTGERIFHGGGEHRIARVKDLECAHLGAAALVDDELRHDLALDALVLQHRRILRCVAADFLDRLLDLEFHIGARVLLFLLDTRFLAGVAFLTCAALYAVRLSAGDTLAAEIGFVGDGLP